MIPADLNSLVYAGATDFGYRPVVQTLASESPLSDGDFIVVRQKPSGARVLLRTTKISQITDNADWDTAAKEDGPGTKVFQQGPDFLAEMNTAHFVNAGNPANVVQSSGGHQDPWFFVGDPTGSQGLWRWKKGFTTWQRIVGPSLTAQTASRFFVDPYFPRIYIIDGNSVKHSEDGGSTWQQDVNLQNAVTENGTFTLSPGARSNANNSVPVGIEDIIFDRFERTTRFAVGNAGVFLTVDGVNWSRLLSSTSRPGTPVSAYFDRISADPISNPGRALYVGTDGQSMIRLYPIPPQAPPQAPTQVGNNPPPVRPVDQTTGSGPVTVTFTKVTQAGVTTLITSSTGNPPPQGFRLGNPAVYYDLATTAHFSGPAQVCVDFTLIAFSNPAGVRLFHFESGSWVDRTDLNGVKGSTVCGTVSSFSPFAVFDTGPLVNLADGISNPMFTGTPGKCPTNWICGGGPDPGFASYSPTSAQYPSGPQFPTSAFSPTILGGSGVIRQETSRTWLGGNTYFLNLWAGLPNTEPNGTTHVEGWAPTARLYLTAGDGFSQVAAFDIPRPPRSTFASNQIKFILPKGSPFDGQKIGVMIFVSAPSLFTANFDITSSVLAP